MLRELSIKNFKSIGHEITFSMEADTKRVSEHPNHVFPINGVNLLRVASMYGPNGGGKSNILDAIVTLNFLLESPEIKGKWNLKCAYCNDDVITEEAYFVTEKYELGYKVSYSLNYDERIRTNLNGEKIIQPITLFNIVAEEVAFRRKDEIDFVTLLVRDEKGKVNLSEIEESSLPVDILLGNRISAVSYYYKTFFNNNTSDQSEAIQIIGELYDEINNIRSLTASPNIDTLKKVLNTSKDKLIKYMCDVDINISDIDIDEKNDIYFIRKVKNNDSGFEEKRLGYNLESEGTHRIFEIFINIISGESNPRIYFADDLNAYLHPKLLRFIVDSFNSEKNTKSQLIFNSHDIISMVKEVYRRDEIWFAYRNNNYQTELVSLANIVNYKGKQIRNDAKYYKQYLEGKYGADPFISKALNWETIDNETKR